MEIYIVTEGFGFKPGTSVHGQTLIVPVSRVIPLKLVVFNERRVTECTINEYNLALWH